MESPLSWLSPAAIEALGWALMHFLWQGAALAALASVLMHFSRSPSTRYLTGVAALVLMPAMPVATFLLLDGPTSNPLAWATVPRAVFAGFASFAHHLLPWLVEGWLAGVALFGLRFAGGFLLLERRRHGQSCAPSAQVLALCHTVQRRLGLTRTIRYLECGWVRVPAVIGCIRPLVLLPVVALTGLTETQLRAVIAHELAHVRRWDLLVNLFQVLAETLLFYHPAIWWLNRRICAERELCCDDIAIAETGNRVEYADALLLMAKLGSASGLAMAATHGVLSERIFHIIGRPSEKSRIAGLAGSLLFFLAALAAGNALLALASPLPALPVRQNTLHIASLTDASGESRLESHPAVTARLNDDDDVIPRRSWRAAIRTLRPSPVSPASALLLIAATDLPVPDDQPVVPPPQSDVPPIPAPVSPSVPARVHVTSVAAQTLEALTMADEEYPAPTLKLLGPFSWHEGPLAEAQDYCKEFAVQTVTQGANRPIAVDDAMKQRLGFFYSHCMFDNGKANGQDLTMPGYIAIGPASSDNPVNVSGSWTVTVHAQSPRSCTFTQSGNTLSGTCTGREGSSAAAGVIDGHQIRWAWKYAPNDELDFIGMVGTDGAITGQSIISAEILELADRVATFTATLGGPQVASRK